MNDADVALLTRLVECLDQKRHCAGWLAEFWTTSGGPELNRSLDYCREPTSQNTFTTCSAAGIVANTTGKSYQTTMHSRATKQRKIWLVWGVALYLWRGLRQPGRPTAMMRRQLEASQDATPDLQTPQDLCQPELWPHDCSNGGLTQPVFVGNSVRALQSGYEHRSRPT